MCHRVLHRLDLWCPTHRALKVPGIPCHRCRTHAGVRPLVRPAGPVRKKKRTVAKRRMKLHGDDSA